MKKKRRIKYNSIIICVVIILFIVLGVCIIDIISSLNNNTKQVEILSSIDEYNYSLNENDSDYFKEKFMLLKDELEGEKDEEKYASLISELFIIDFYSLDNSVNKNDIGGVQFVYSDYQNDFIKYAKDGIYKYVENNIYKDRKQELPVVLNTKIKNIEQKSVSFKNDITDDKAYIANILIEYEEDLDYPTEVELTIIHNENKLEIAKME